MATNSRNLCSPDLETMLASRNSLLSSFWLSDQAAMRIEPSGDRDLLTGKSIMIIDFEDAFTMMLRHLLVSLGAEASIVSWRSVSETDVRCDLVVVGPGPGDPNDNHDLRIQTGRRVTERLLSTKRPFLSVCLGHQILCRALGLKVVKKSSVSQGTQEEIDIFGESRCVGFYNTFVAKWPANGLPGVKASLGKDSYVYALRGDHFASFQFHVESVLTKDGREILARVLRELMQEGASEG